MVYKNKDKQRRTLRKWNLKAKKEVLTRYGKDKCACVKCGFSDMRALSLDHIANDGAEKRRTNKHIRYGGISLYIWLRKEGYPRGYQTLCMNCQMIKRDEIYKRE